jgi:hypothetical protein
MTPININTNNQIQRIYRFLRERREDQKFFKYVEITSTFFLISILLLFAIKPTASAISTLLGDIKSKELLSQKLTAKINSVVQAQEAYSEVQEKYPIIESSLPDYPKFYQGSANFSYFSKQSNIPINQISFELADSGQESVSDNITSFGVTLRNKGTYLSFINYINSVLKSRRLIDLENIQISVEKDTKGNPGGGLNLLLNSNLFYLKD